MRFKHGQMSCFHPQSLASTHLGKQKLLGQAQLKYKWKAYSKVSTLQSPGDGECRSGPQARIRELMQAELLIAANQRQNGHHRFEEQVDLLWDEQGGRWPPEGRGPLAWELAGKTAKEGTKRRGQGSGGLIKQNISRRKFYREGEPVLEGER